ncbi:hypothetical protein V6N13_048254 [Hibiscus sabdariffa]
MMKKMKKPGGMYEVIITRSGRQVGKHAVESKQQNNENSIKKEMDKEVEGNILAPIVDATTKETGQCSNFGTLPATMPTTQPAILLQKPQKPIPRPPPSFPQ